MKTILPLLSLLLLIAADVGTPKIDSPAAVKAISTYDQEALRLRTTYYQALVIADKKEIAALQATMTQQMDHHATPDAIEQVNTAKKQAQIRLLSDTIALNGGVITIKTFIDGDSQLHLTYAGMYWTNGDTEKPGFVNGQPGPTFVNDAEWFPQWQTTGERGPDKSELFPISVGGDYTLSLIAISSTQNGTDIQPRDPVTISSAPEGDVVSIPDTQIGGMWYTIRLTPTSPDAR